jgi:hypothetical protein
VIGFIPPSQFGHSNPVVYAVLILAGILAIGFSRRSCWSGSASRGGRQPAVGQPSSCSPVGGQRARPVPHSGGYGAEASRI